MSPQNLPPTQPNSNSRAGVISAWLARIEATEAALTALSSFLQMACDLAPADVDGGRFIDLEGATINAMDDLTRDMQRIEYEDLYLALTGQRSYLLVITNEIKGGIFDPARLQAEINHLGQDDPAGGALLQSLLDSRLGGA